MMTRGIEFLPVSREEMIDRGWYYYDFLVVTADGYIDHPSFGTTLIARLLESKGYRVAILPQPDWHTADAFRAMGKPRYGVLIGGPLHGGQAPPHPRPLQRGRCHGQAARPAHHRLRQPRP